MRLIHSLVAFAAVGVLPAWSQGNSSSAADAAVQQMAKALPSCALQCLATLIPESGCALTDVACICTNTQLNQQSAVCLTSTCTVPEALATQKYQSGMCGVPVRDNSNTPRAVAWALFSLALASVILRFVARSSQMNGPGYGWDDWTILMVLPFLLAGNTMTDIMTRNGLGMDMYMLSPNEITTVLRLFWANEFTYIGVLASTKISILLLYLRIFPNMMISNWFRNTCYVLMSLLVGYAVSMWFSIGFQCTPSSYFYTQWDGLHEGHCINVNALIFASAGINIAYDLFVFFLPFPKVWGLQLNGRKKLGVCLTFLVGLFTTICSIVRLQYLVKWGNSTNPTWDYTDLTTWSLVEGNVTVVCACMPPMAGLAKKFWRKTESYISSKSKSGGYSSGSGASQSMPERKERFKTSKNISKTATTTVCYDDRAPSANADEVELVAKSTDPAWEAGYPRQFV